MINLAIKPQTLFERFWNYIWSSYILKDAYTEVNCSCIASKYLAIGDLIQIKNIYSIKDAGYNVLPAVQPSDLLTVCKLINIKNEYIEECKKYECYTFIR